jgi:hypothetical protein
MLGLQAVQKQQRLCSHKAAKRFVFVSLRFRKSRNRTQIVTAKVTFSKQFRFGLV